MEDRDSIVTEGQRARGGRSPARHRMLRVVVDWDAQNVVGILDSGGEVDLSDVLVSFEPIYKGEMATATVMLDEQPYKASLSSVEDLEKEREHVFEDSRGA